MNRSNTKSREVAVFGGGCFWCTEAVFQRLRGVINVKPGYSGGHVPNPTYEQVSAGDTGHVESTQVEFDPAQISFETLLDVFFATHDPTTPNRQGHDAGPQYQSVIFYASDAQKKIAENYIAKLVADQTFRAPIVTELRQFEKFYPAENYHQNYYNQNRSAGYCRLVIDPKIAKLKAKFTPLLKPE